MGLCLAGSATAREVRITILHTSDLHGHVLSLPDDKGREGVGGLLRIATAVAQIRQEEPNVLLIDCGDLVQGSIEAHLTRGRVMLKAAEWLKYDAWVMGNHEWDWGIEHLGRLIETSRVPMLAGNLDMRVGAPSPLRKVGPLIVKDYDGVKVAIVGLTTPGMPMWFRPEYLGDAQFKVSKEALRGILPYVRQAAPDITVLAVHQGLRTFDDRANEINAIAAQFPEFDVILGGHSHAAIPSRMLGDVLYTQAGCHGQALGRVDLVYDTVADRLKEKRAALIEIADGFAEDPALAAHLEGDLAPAREFRTRLVGTAAVKLKAVSEVPGQSGLQQLFCRAIAGASKAEIVLHGVHSTDPLAAGEIRMDDIWRIMPYENRVGIARLTCGEIEAILEENADQLGGTHFMGVYGLTYDLDPRGKEGSRVSNIRLADGTVPHARQRLDVAMNSFVLASGGGRFPVLRGIVERPTSRLILTDIDIRQALVEYVRRHSPLQDMPVEGPVQAGK